MILEILLVVWAVLITWYEVFVLLVDWSIILRGNVFRSGEDVSKYSPPRSFKNIFTLPTKL
jgi:hypothetical protein